MYVIPTLKNKNFDSFGDYEVKNWCTKEKYQVNLSKSF